VWQRLKYRLPPIRIFQRRYLTHRLVVRKNSRCRRVGFLLKIYRTAIEQYDFRSQQAIPGHCGSAIDDDSSCLQQPVDFAARRYTRSRERLLNALALRLRLLIAGSG
jgi:hypothetical protein